MQINLNSTEHFVNRHIGPSKEGLAAMLKAVGVNSIDELIDETVPEGIRKGEELKISKALSEFQYLQMLKGKAAKNKVYKSYIGLGYSETIVPTVIKRNVLENPGWYTQYTPYQAEIAQGRLEALLNFQTMVSDLTAMPIANASLLDEGTAVAEAMAMFFALKNKRKVESPKFFVADTCLPQTIDIVKTRSKPIGVETVIGDAKNVELDESYFAIVLQYPDVNGAVEDYRAIVEDAKSKGIYVIVAADLLSLALLTPPGEWGADCVVGNTQRFGVPLGFGGPHAAYFATKAEYKRVIPGRIIGISLDRHENPALRMALQTREQHIRRDKATSNICTAQALLAIMAGMYAVYHGAEGLKNIATRVHTLARLVAIELTDLGYDRVNQFLFDTVTIEADKTISDSIKKLAEAKGINFRYDDGLVGISIGETTQVEDIIELVGVFAEAKGKGYSGSELLRIADRIEFNYPAELTRSSSYLDHNVFKQHRSETQLLRYIKSLENKDLSLTKSMIPLGSCTMKLNATSELEPISWEAFSNIHPFAPSNQVEGYIEIIEELEKDLSELTGFDACSLQPNSGAQGEYSGLLVMKAYHESNGDKHRNIVLIPSSAHGTNPASAVMAGCKVVVVGCDDYGNIDFEDLQAKALEHRDSLMGLMVTYPSTHGVFEHKIKDICKAIHENGGQVYMDGANMNAQVGLTSPGIIGADVCHLNLHKTFAIPHGGGGPGMGPICVKSHLAPFLPSNPIVKTGGDKAIKAISAAPWGSASILLISYGYIKMLGKQGLLDSTKYAILNANYIKNRLEEHYDVLYVGKEAGRVAHELILDFRPFKHTVNVEVEDVAKRLIDYGFHAPTVSFPVAGTMMIEPTESEDLAEIDRFCEAMIAIRKEIAEIANGEANADNNVLKNAPHTVDEVMSDDWDKPYSREKAAFPLPFTKHNKFWPTVARVNNSHGDRNLICTCPPMEAYA